MRRRKRSRLLAAVQRQAPCERTIDWVAVASALRSWARRRLAPKALVLNTANPIMVQGAALADFTMVSGFEVDLTPAIPDGALLEIDPNGEQPCVRVLSPAGS